MEYKGFDIVKIEPKKFVILDKFKGDVTKHTYRSKKEAQEVIDNVILRDLEQRRFMPAHYSRWWWGVIDKRTNLYYRKENGKLLLFKKRQDCFDWCQEHNGFES